jgi:hypothetical protein
MKRRRLESSLLDSATSFNGERGINPKISNLTTYLVADLAPRTVVTPMLSFEVA